MFLPGTSMKDAVIESLKDGDKSISSLYRHLDAEGFKMHRLVLTGYLKALEDLNLLKAKDIPPSKVYSSASTGEMNLYQVIGALALSSVKTEAEASRLAVYCMQRLYKRPVFLEELRAAGFAGDIQAERVTGEERNEVKKALARKGHKLPDNDPAFRIARPDETLDAYYTDILASALLSKFRSHSLVMETKQTKLSE